MRVPCRRAENSGPGTRRASVLRHGLQRLALTVNTFWLPTSARPWGCPSRRWSATSRCLTFSLEKQAEARRPQAPEAERSASRLIPGWVARRAGAPRRSQQPNSFFTSPRRGGSASGCHLRTPSIHAQGR
ncbi:hypothetical protein ANANG_G00162200 [Anguilla anguilla]|uniref:Uncharacterized protein n=1 Tax=Anguilla anguilla TaxID=7936 RepID=A0A9D3RYZ4_ANGAN|nr:hypothetical protein ANANG_G00162200 [Anguilla anguilla]